MTPTDTTDERASRPRVVGEREQEILDATLEVLAEVGYDRLTMDAVAVAARASKATLYRRWAAKPELVIEALLSQKATPEPVDTGSLRGDLLAMFCASGGLTDARQAAVMSSVITAIGRDPEFAAAFRRDFIAPKAELAVLVFRRAQHRGEVHPDADVELLATALPGIVLHRRFFLGEVPDESLVAQVVDQLVLPAATHGPASPSTRPTPGTTPAPKDTP